MKVGAPKEILGGEARVALTPDSAVQLQKLGHACLIESGAGLAAGFSDAAYRASSVEAAIVGTTGGAEVLAAAAAHATCSQSRSTAGSNPTPGTSSRGSQPTASRALPANWHG